MSNEHHRTLRAKAQQNIISVTEAVSEHATLAPHLQEIVGALWLRSIAVGNLAGAEPQTLQVGDATLLPTRIKMSKPKHEPRSATIPFWTRWATPKAEVDLVAAVENMRRQSRT